MEDFCQEVRKIKRVNDYPEIFARFSGEQMTKFLLMYRFNFNSISSSVNRKLDSLRVQKLNDEVLAKQIGIF